MRMRDKRVLVGFSSHFLLFVTPSATCRGKGGMCLYETRVLLVGLLWHAAVVPNKHPWHGTCLWKYFPLPTGSHEPLTLKMLSSLRLSPAGRAAAAEDLPEDGACQMLAVLSTGSEQQE